ncbi:hypothetical protein CEXT_265341 [Caerostris extrusa]|uniref:Uncharacterized protein n=1 Tax=Caerostris extrusa TaxID=172846 RepID=A0AAV4WG90_CAEEX|nr:hypothetical protein CEXT_265341 [Caerostris extrusa]
MVETPMVATSTPEVATSIPVVATSASEVAASIPVVATSAPEVAASNPNIINRKCHQLNADNPSMRYDMRNQKTIFKYDLTLNAL